MNVLLPCSIVVVVMVDVLDCARFVSTRQSSTFQGRNGALSTDGDDSTFFMTGFQYNAWWTGILDTECPVKAVEIHGEHPRIAILAGTHLSDNGFGKPTQQNPMCRLIDRWTQPGHPEQHTYTCDVLRNATAIDIIAVGRIHSSLTLHEVKVHCA